MEMAETITHSLFDLNGNFEEKLSMQRCVLFLISLFSQKKLYRYNMMMFIAFVKGAHTNLSIAAQGLYKKFS